MKQHKVSKLEARAITLLQQQPDISMPEFARLLGKGYGHAGSLMYKARRHLGIQVRDEITKVEKTKALLTLKPKANAKLIMRLMEVRTWRAYELKSIAQERLNAGQHTSTKAVEWARHKLHGHVAKTAPTFDDEAQIPEQKQIATPIQCANIFQSALAEIIDLAKRDAPHPKFTYEKCKDPHLLEISIPDLHIGKFALIEETGEAYDSHIATMAFLNAVDDLAIQASHSEIEQIVFPLGNDYLTADNLEKTTTRGTAQDYYGSQLTNLRLAWKLAVAAIDRLTTIAPVEVIMVPGNHDTYSTFTVGLILEAVYSRSPMVTVRNSLKPRHYKAYGKNLLGFTHGHLEKQRSLPMLMATEARKLWAGSEFREFHLGHYHHTKDVSYMATSEDEGVIVRILPSLSAADRWHSRRGYRAQRAAQALVYHPEYGLRAIYRHNFQPPQKHHQAQILHQGR